MNAIYMSISFLFGENSCQPGRPPSLISPRAQWVAQWVAKDPRCRHTDSEDSDQSGWI